MLCYVISNKAITLASSIVALLGLLKREKIRTAVKEKITIIQCAIKRTISVGTRKSLML